MSQLLAEDPILSVPEFSGEFQVGAQSCILRRLLLTGSYEADLVASCLPWIDTARDAIDVGANVGFYSVFLAKLLKAGRVLAVEPAPASLKRLKANLMRNCVSDRVLVFEGAAGSISGKAVLNVVPGMEEYSFLGENPHEAVADAEVMQIAVAEVTLDSLTDSYKLNPGFIKVDVEGYELDVLLGAQTTLQTARPVILVESAIASSTSPKDQRLRLFEYLASIRYFPLDPISGKTMRARDLLEEVLFVPLERTNGRRQST